MPESHALSRRSVLKGAAGVGAAGIAASALAGVTLPAAAAEEAQLRTTSMNGSADERDEGADEAIVVHVRDAASGELDVFRGTGQVRLHDRALAARIVRASR